MLFNIFFQNDQCCCAMWRYRLFWIVVLVLCRYSHLHLHCKVPCDLIFCKVTRKSFYCMQTFDHIPFLLAHPFPRLSDLLQSLSLTLSAVLLGRSITLNKIMNILWARLEQMASTQSSYHSVIKRSESSTRGIILVGLQHYPGSDGVIASFYIKFHFHPVKHFAVAFQISCYEVNQTRPIFRLES